MLFENSTHWHQNRKSYIKVAQSCSFVRATGSMQQQQANKQHQAASLPTDKHLSTLWCNQPFNYVSLATDTTSIDGAQIKKSSKLWQPLMSLHFITFLIEFPSRLRFSVKMKVKGKLSIKGSPLEDKQQQPKKRELSHFIGK